MSVEAGELARAPLFSSLPAAELESLAENAGRLEVPAGDELARAGDFGHCMFVVCEGTAQVLVDGNVVRDLSAGDAFGEVAVVASGRRTASVVATSPMTLITLFKTDIWEIEKRNPTFSEQVRKLSQQRA